MILWHDSSDYDYRGYLEELKNTESYLDNVSKEASATLDLLSSLSKSFKSVETQTTAFQKQCEDLMAEQKRLESLANNVGENLQYYSFLEPITRKLNAPGAGNFVRGREFSDMLARLDECLDYMNNHVRILVHHSYSILTILAIPTRGAYISIQIPASPHQRSYAYKSPFHCGSERHCHRCDQTNC